MSGTGPGPDDPGWAAPAPPPPPPAPPPAAPAPPAGVPPGPAWSPPPPPPPPPPGAAWTPPPGTARRRKGRWLLVLVPLLVVFVAGVAFLAVEVVGLVAEPIDATNEYLADLQARRYEAAYDRTCTYASVAPSLDQFVARQRAIDASLGRLSGYDITSAKFTDGGATTDGTWTRGGRELDVSFRLEQVGDDWKVCAVRDR